MRRPFRPLRPTTWPHWVWYLVAVAWCALATAAGGGVNVLVGLGWSWPITVGTFVVAVVLTVGSMARQHYKSWRADR